MHSVVGTSKLCPLLPSTRHSKRPMRVSQKDLATACTHADEDAYYLAPTGKRFRSRREVAMALGLLDNDRKLTLEAALRGQGSKALENVPPRKMDGPHMSRRAALKQGTAAVGGMTESVFNSLLQKIKKRKKCRCCSSGLVVLWAHTAHQ